MQRPYFPHRRAYFPRVWPMMLASVALVLPPVTIVNTLGFSLAYTFAVAVGVVQGRLWLWRRRHPVITPEEYLGDMREKATWN